MTIDLNDCMEEDEEPVVGSVGIYLHANGDFTMTTDLSRDIVQDALIEALRAHVSLPTPIGVMVH